MALAHAVPAAAQNELTVEHLAGSTGGWGWFDGIAQARFASPSSVAADGNGNVYVCDSYNGTIRRIVVATGEVTTLAGTAGVVGSADGIGAAARFNYPRGIAWDGNGHLYISDYNNDTIRKIVVATGEVTTFAGSAGVSGSANGTGAAARFYEPIGLAVDSNGNLFVADRSNNTIRQIVLASAEVTTLAGSAGLSGSANGTGSSARFKSPSGVAVDANGDVFVADSSNHTIRKIVVATKDVTTLAGTAGSSGTTDSTGSAARFNSPFGISADASGNLFVGDTSNHRIRQVVIASASVTTLVGSGFFGSVDAIGTAARFNFPAGVTVDGSGSLFVADNQNDSVRRVVVATAAVTTLAGVGRIDGSTDGAATLARFKRPRGVAADSAGNVFVADTDNHTIRRIEAVTREVTTLAGTVGVTGAVDGTGTAARFASPESLVVADVGGVPSLFVTDGSHTIRMIVIATGVVTTVAGTAWMSGSDDGIGSAARFYEPSGIASDGAGHLYVADERNHTIRKFDIATAAVTTIAGSAGSSGSSDGIGPAARFNTPWGVAVGGSGTLFVADTSNSAIRRIVLATNAVVTVAGSHWGADGYVDGFGNDARFAYPSGIGVDSAGDVYIADTNNSAIRKLNVETSEVTTVAGSPDSWIAADGTGSEAAFGMVFGLALDGADNIYMVDYWNHCIRVARPPIADAPTIDPPSALPGTPVQLDTAPQTATAWTWEIVRRPSTSAATLSSASVRNPTITPDVLDHFVFRLTAEGAGRKRIAMVTFKGGYGLTVSRDGVGSGTVSSSPVGIDCGADCSGTFGSGSVVTLTATPGYGSTFTGWSGAGCSGTGTCSVTMTGVQSVTATFGCGSWYVDADGDGHGLAGVPLNTCTPPAGYAMSSDDCDDTRASVYPGAPEICDGIDNDCDGFAEQMSFSGAMGAWPLQPPSCGIGLQWTPATYACQPVLYNVYRSTDPLFVPDASNRIAACVSGSIYDDGTGLANATDYYYVVRAEAGSGSGACGGTEDTNSVRVQAPQLTCAPAPEPLRVFAITAKDQSAVLNWSGPDQGPSQPYSVMFRYMTEGYFPYGPSFGSLMHIATGQTFGGTGSAAVPYLLNNTTYYISGFVDDGAGSVWSGARSARVRPFSTSGKVKWGYGTGATATTPLGLRRGATMYAVSNDRVLHAMTPGSTGGEWPVGWKPMIMNGPSQSRPTPVQLSTFTIGGESLVVLLASQDGRVYAASGTSGEQLWASPVLGDAIQPSPSACLVQNGCATDLILVPTRNGSSDNKIVALDPQTGTIIPGTRGWEFDNGGGTNGIGIIAGQIAVQSGVAPRLYFASRQKAGGTTETVFCLEFGATAVTKAWSRSLGDIDGALVLVGGILHVGTNNGAVHALNAADGTDRWTTPYVVAGDGAVNSIVWPDGSGRIFFSTQSKVHGIVDNGQNTAPTNFWTTPVSLLNPSNPIVMSGKAYVGAGDGKVYEIDATTATPAPPKSVTLGGAGAVGRATYDGSTKLLQMGTESGVVYAVEIPF